MTNKQVFEQVKEKIDWIIAIANRKKWTITETPFIDKGATDAEISLVETRIGKTIPEDFKELFRFSKHLEFSYQFGETLSEEFRQNFSGEIYWNLDLLPQLFVDFQEWIEASLDPAYNDPEAISITGKIWENKLPLISVANGDFIAVGNNPSEVIYFSHEGGDMHGKILGNTLWEFLEFYSSIGFAGSEDWQLKPFYDFSLDRMNTDGNKVQRYIALLEK